ncbi:MAG: YbaY family lipoprotein [Planctomycetaceae bacterium]|nr:YbaY family lipoprotein [Planctomycetaceae bacterium]
MSLRNFIRCAAGAAFALVLTLPTQAHAVDPSRHALDRDRIVPQPYDPLLPGSGAGTYGNPGSFDPFAPVGGTGSTLPLSQQEQMRLNPQLNLSPNPSIPAAEAPRWRLGVYSMDTGTGVQVVRVTPGSPAHAAGIEPDDMIITVAGYQVGLIENNRREMGQAFNDYASPEGHVNLLVQDRRTRNLTNVYVRLESRMERIEGTVTFREDVRLPRNAEIKIELYETIRQGVTYPIVSKTVTNWQRQPIPFVLDYDPSLVDPRREYSIQATIVADNRTYYQTRNAYRVITAGYPRVVDLSLYSTSNSLQGGLASNRDEQLEQIMAWYREYLNRDIRASERQVYSSSIDRGQSMDEIRAQVLGLPEFYVRSGEGDEAYIRRLYEVVLNRQPTQQEVTAWLRQLQAQNGIRVNLAREFLTAVSSPR